MRSRSSVGGQGRLIPGGGDIRASALRDELESSKKEAGKGIPGRWRWVCKGRAGESRTRLVTGG